MGKSSAKQRVTQLMEWKKTLKSQRSKPKVDDSTPQRVNLGYNVKIKNMQVYLYWIEQNTFEHECSGAQYAVEQAIEQETYEHFKSVIEIQSHTKDNNTGEGYYVEYTFEGKQQTLSYTMTNTNATSKKQTDDELISNLAKTHLQNLINDTYVNNE